jgi:hypothetical protein
MPAHCRGRYGLLHALTNLSGEREGARLVVAWAAHAQEALGRCDAGLKLAERPAHPLVGGAPGLLAKRTLAQARNSRSGSPSRASYSASAHARGNGWSERFAAARRRRSVAYGDASPAAFHGGSSAAPSTRSGSQTMRGGHAGPVDPVRRPGRREPVLVQSRPISHPRRLRPGAAEPSPPPTPEIGR